MITSKRIIDIYEKYFRTGLVRNSQIDIYENPTSSDFIKLEKTAREYNRKLVQVRFIANADTKRVYVADASICIHQDLEDTVKLPSNSLPYILGGLAFVTGGRARAELAMMTLRRGPKDYNTYDWTWCDSYVSNFSDEIKKYK